MALRTIIRDSSQAHEDARLGRARIGHETEASSYDEPFAALDEITRLQLNNDLLELWQAQGLTVIFVTHSIYESVYLSDASS